MYKEIFSCFHYLINQVDDGDEQETADEPSHVEMPPMPPYFYPEAGEEYEVHNDVCNEISHENADDTLHPTIEDI